MTERPLDVQDLSAILDGKLRRDLTGRARMTTILERIERVLERAIATLPDEDRLIMRMYYLDGFTAAQIGRALGCPQQALYDRLERGEVQVERFLEADGLTAREVRALIEPGSRVGARTT